MRTVFIQPGALTRAEAEQYVGGRIAFEAMEREFPEIIKPFYQSQKRKHYRIVDLEKGMAAALLLSNPLGPPAKTNDIRMTSKAGTRYRGRGNH